MPLESNWTQYPSKQKKVLCAVNERIQQLNTILQSGNRTLKEARSKSQYSAFCIQRFVGSAMNRFFSMKFEILSNAKIRLNRSKSCRECAMTEKCLREVTDLVNSPAMTFDQLQSDIGVILEKVLMVGSNEVERSSDAVINEFTECISKTKEESRELEAAMKLSKEAAAKLKDQLKKAFADGYTGDESSLPQLKRAAKEIRTRHADFIASAHNKKLNEEIERHRRLMNHGCVDCVAAHAIEFEAAIESIRQSIMERTTITQAMIDQEKATCPICREDLPLGFTSALSCPRCHQVYDKTCMGKWLSEHTNCPCCRQELTVEQDSIVAVHAPAMHNIPHGFNYGRILGLLLIPALVIFNGLYFAQTAL